MYAIRSYYGPKCPVTRGTTFDEEGDEITRLVNIGDVYTPVLIKEGEFALGGGDEGGLVFIDIVITSYSIHYTKLYDGSFAVVAVKPLTVLSLPVLLVDAVIDGLCFQGCDFLLPLFLSYNFV